MSANVFCASLFFCMCTSMRGCMQVYTYVCACVYIGAFRSVCVCTCARLHVRRKTSAVLSAEPLLSHAGGCWWCRLLCGCVCCLVSAVMVLQGDSAAAVHFFFVLFFGVLGSLMDTDVFGVPLPRGSAPSGPHPLCPFQPSHSVLSLAPPSPQYTPQYLSSSFCSSILYLLFLFSPHLLVTPSSILSLPFCPFTVLVGNGRPFNTYIVWAMTTLSAFILSLDSGLSPSNETSSLLFTSLLIFFRSIDKKMSSKEKCRFLTPAVESFGYVFSYVFCPF